MPYPCNEGKIQEFRHASVFNHSCVAKLTIVYQSQNNTSMLLTLSWTQLLCTWTGYRYYGDFLSRKNLIAICTSMIK